MPAPVEARVCELRRQRPHWGPVTIAYRLTREGVDQIPSQNGIAHRLTAARLPTTTGKIERAVPPNAEHRVPPDGCSPRSDTQNELDGWVDECNTERPNRTLKLATPAAASPPPLAPLPGPPLDRLAALQ